jgi:hypothetical protein
MQENIFSRKNKSVSFLLAIFLSLLFALAFPPLSYAATLFITPTSASYAVGQTFSEVVKVSSSDKQINAISASISYPKDLLSLISISKSNSIIKIWADEPSFSNTTGTLSFEGIVPNPGFQGESGVALTLTFKVKAVGSGVVAFSSASVLANDGNGTNVLDSTSPAKFSSDGGDIKSPGTDVVLKETLASKAKIISTTHPDQSAWYNDTNPEFSWVIPQGATAVFASLNKEISSAPTKAYSSDVTSKSYTDVADGIWYFNLQFKTSAGIISTNHFKVQIDTVPPEAMRISFPHSNQSFDPRPLVRFSTTDRLSGISYYQIKIKNQDYYKIDKSTAASPLALPPQDLGKGSLLVQAFDNAGNVTTATADFIVEALNPPKITEVPESLQSGDIFRIQGDTYPQVTAYVSLKDESGKVVTEDTQSNNDGHFSLIWPKRLPDGLYVLTAYVVDAKGAKSTPSPEIIIKVNGGELLRLGWLTANYLSLILFILILIALVMSGGFYLWHKIASFRRTLATSVHKSESEIHKIFNLLREDMEEHLKNLDQAKSRRELTLEEESIIKSLKKNLTQAEAVISKAIDNIAK